MSQSNESVLKCYVSFGPLNPAFIFSSVTFLPTETLSAFHHGIHSQISMSLLRCENGTVDKECMLYISVRPPRSIGDRRHQQGGYWGLSPPPAPHAMRAALPP